MNFKIISNLKEAEEAWKTLSPNEVIYDDWDFRFTYYKYFNYPLYFYAAYDKDELVALLPLMLNTDNNLLDFFAGFEYMEDNRVFAKNGYKYLAQDLIDMIDLPANLNYMHETMASLKGASQHDTSYYFNLNNLNSSLDYIEKKFTKESRYKLKKMIRDIDRLGIEKIEDKFDDIDYMVRFNKERFGKNSTFYTRPYWEEFYRDLLDNFKCKTITLKIENKVIGVGMSIIHNSIITTVNYGAENSIRDLRKYIIFSQLDQAIQGNFKICDAGAGSFGWKEELRLEKRPQFKIEINL